MEDNNSIATTAILESHTLKHWIALKQVPRLTTRLKLKLVEKYGIVELFNFSQQLLVEHGFTDAQQRAFLSPDWTQIQGIVDYCQSQQIKIMSYGCSSYPTQLKEIASPPLILFAKGDASLLRHDQIAIVGSRRTSTYGRDNAFNLAYDLAQSGFVITSGLALGVDGFAHQGCLKGQGKTIAVLATGVDVIYPARHKALAAEILRSGGLLITESFPGTRALAGLFPKRNRLISGLSIGVVIVEAAIKSGSLVTAKYAVEHNREIFAFPGSVHNPQAAGCHQLIKQGAKLIENCADVIEEVQSQRLLPVQRLENCVEKKSGQSLCDDPLLDSVGYETTPVDLVVSRSKLPTDVVLTRLTILELRGLVTAVPGGYLRNNGG